MQQIWQRSLLQQLMVLQLCLHLFVRTTTSKTDSRSTKNDGRSATVKAASPFYLEFDTDEILVPRYRTEANTINTIIRNTTQTIITEAEPYVCYLDLFQTRNLYLTSSALASYDTVSNFGIDTIIKKIPCTAGYNKLLTQSSGSTLDVLDVSKRTLRFIDFNPVDGSF